MKARLLAAEDRVIERLRVTEPRRLTRVHGPLLLGAGAVAGCLLGAFTVLPVLAIMLGFGVAVGYVARELVSRRRRERLRQERFFH